MLIGFVGIAIALLWLFIIYLPRRTAEGEAGHPAGATETAEPVENTEERD
jgi:hypothetical protein